MLCRRICCCGCCQTFTVVCGATPLAGATVSISGGPSGTTDGSGAVVLCGAGAGSRTVTTSKAGYTTKTSTITLTCGGSYTIQMCGGTTSCGSCAIPDDLFLTDANGTWPFIYLGSYWQAQYTVSLPGVITGGGASCFDPYTVGTGAVGVTYQGTCVNIGGTYYFSVSQYFNGQIVFMDAGVPVYAGSFDFLSCSWSCGGGGPVRWYYFAGGSGGYLWYTGTSVWTSCSPFSWSMSVPNGTAGMCGSIVIPAGTTPAPGTVTVSG